MGVYRALPAVSEASAYCTASSRATYTTEQVLLEVERDVCVLLNDLQDLAWGQRLSAYRVCAVCTLMPSAMTWLSSVSHVSGSRA